IDSYSKYLEYPEVQEYLAKNVSPEWLDDVLHAKDILYRGKEAREQINILGDDGVPINFHERYWKSELIDFVILQQDAFDKIDAVTPMKRQKYMLAKVLSVAGLSFRFDNFENVGTYFKQIINVFKQMNYSDFESEKFVRHEQELEELLKERMN
ncbi:MAG TPA: V-type ATP synthase subunit A, partial [Prolixibacteraceae bacterium]|nr:V-type ATP synthase subunit A [Prolixibacteraceae bacterium]